jgi:hypothetical protein
MITEMEYHNWPKFYQQLKTEIQEKRKISTQLSVNDKKVFNDRLNALEKAVNVMREAPMEYEM